jgi:glycerol-3-phosphate dehydrogenase
MNRQETLQEIQDNPDISVLVIGGGINGVGVFRDLALQGVDVLLVEKGDFCSGASAASSHMVHGGLRYLENGEFRLVREALTERNRLLQNAPHYVHPLPTTIPIFSWFSGILNAPLKFLRLRDKPGDRGAVVIKLGLTMYDWFTRNQQTLPRHKFYAKSKSLTQRPSLNPEIVATATYYDAWMPYPERICIELIADAEAASPQAHAMNYMKVTGAEGNVVTLTDEITGETYTVQPNIVVNAAGPWIDFTNQALNNATQFIGGTKGSHLVVDHPELHAATQGHEMFFQNADGRITLFFPLIDRVLIGTTDIRIDDPDEAVCSDDEIEYMLDMIKIVFPTIKVDRSHIVFTFSGVRPLPQSEAGMTGQISRDHSIKTVEAGNGINFPILSLIGGKWTTFRAFAEQATDRVLERLGRMRSTGTEQTSIGGGQSYPATETARKQWLDTKSADIGIDRNRLETLFERYGTRAEAIARFIIEGDDAPLRSQDDYSRREIQYVAAHEYVVHLDDFLLRRSLLGMLGKVDSDVLEDVADALAQTLEWSESEKAAEIERAVTLFDAKHRVKLAQKVT